MYGANNSMSTLNPPYTKEQQTNIQKQLDLVTPKTSINIARFLARSANISPEEIQRIIQSDQFDPNASDSKQRTPFYFAAKYGNIELASALLKRGADCSINSKSTFSALAAALDKQSLFVQWFFNQLSSEDERIQFITMDDKYGYSLLSLAIGSNINSLQYLLNCLDNLPENKKIEILVGGNRHNLLHLAALHAESLKLLLNYLGNLPDNKKIEVVMKRDQHGNTLLHKAASDFGSLMRLLNYLNNLSQNKKFEIMVHDTNNDGRSPLQLAFIFSNCFLNYFKLPDSEKFNLVNESSLLLLAKRQNHPKSMKAILNYLPMRKEYDGSLTLNVDESSNESHKLQQDKQAEELLEAIMCDLYALDGQVGLVGGELCRLANGKEIKVAKGAALIFKIYQNFKECSGGRHRPAGGVLDKIIAQAYFSDQYRGHGFFNQRQESTALFYKKIIALKLDLHEEKPIPRCC